MASIHTHSPLFCQLRGPRSNDTSVATSTPSTQILFPNNIFQEKKTRLLREIGVSRT